MSGGNSRLENLIPIVQQLKKEKVTLEKEIVEIDRQYQQLQKNFAEITEKYEDLQKKYQQLKLARAFGSSVEDKKEYHRRLTKMIGDIDKCLNVLNE